MWLFGAGAGRARTTMSAVACVCVCVCVSAASAGQDYWVTTSLLKTVCGSWFQHIATATIGTTGIVICWTLSHTHNKGQLKIINHSFCICCGAGLVADFSFSASITFPQILPMTRVQALTGAMADGTVRSRYVASRVFACPGRALLLLLVAG